MASNPFVPQPRLPGHWGGYMLGARRTPPPPRPQDYAAAMLNHMLDGGQIRQEEEESSVDEDENIDPQLRVHTQPQPRPLAGEFFCS